MDLTVKLAGFNVDKDGLDQLKEVLSKNEQIQNNSNKEAQRILANLTPETISASYARISRDSRPIPELREDSRKDVKASRNSNKAIIFTMGHKSIAEHAIFNFDIMGLSRRAIETIEKGRLCSYTEKSQRYITLDGDFVIPNEIKGTQFEQEFVDLISTQNEFYFEKLPELQKWHFNQNYTDLFDALRCKDPERQKGVLEGLGKEDARYSLAMATQAQLGMTVSARNLESLISLLRSSNVDELKQLGEEMFTCVDGIAPSVIKYTGIDPYFSKTRDDLEQHIKELIPKTNTEFTFKNVSLFNKLNRDDSIIAGLIFSSTDLPYEQCLKFTQNLTLPQKQGIVDVADKYQEVHDPKLREYELGDRVSEFVLSSSAFAQIKRHRMNTLISQRYSPHLGIIIPQSVLETNNSDSLQDIRSSSNQLYDKMLNAGLPREVCEYVLTNAHKRRVLFDANNRQAHAFCAERMNLPAQWDIRNLATEYANLIKEESPITTAKLCGKHAFYD